MILPEIDVQIIYMMDLETIVNVLHLNKSLDKSIFRSITSVIEKIELSEYIQFTKTLFRTKEFALVKKILHEDQVHHLWNRLEAKSEYFQNTIKRFSKLPGKYIKEHVERSHYLLYQALFLAAANDQERMEMYITMEPANHEWDDFDLTFETALSAASDINIFYETFLQAVIKKRAVFYLAYGVKVIPHHRKCMIKSPHLYNRDGDRKFLQTYDEKITPLLIEG